jgi:hypothetical protein
MVSMLSQPSVPGSLGEPLGSAAMYTTPGVDPASFGAYCRDAGRSGAIRVRLTKPRGVMVHQSTSACRLGRM